MRTQSMKNGFILAVLFIVGCGVPKEGRKTAEVLALYTTQVKVETESYSNSRTALTRARVANVDFLEQSATKVENENAIRLKVWELSGNGDCVKFIQKLTDVSDTVAKQEDSFATLQARQEAAIASLKSSVNIQSKQLDEAAKTLSALAKEASLIKDVKFYVSFLSDVRKDIKNISTNTAVQVNAGSEEIKNKTANNSKP